MENSPKQSANSELLQRLEDLEQRISQIEDTLHLQTLPRPSSEVVSAEEPVPEEKESLEYRIGFYWFAKAGIVTLAVGIALFLTFPYQGLPPFVPSLIGFVLAAGLILAARLLRNSFALMSRYFFGSGMALLYFATLRLHFLTNEPLLDSRVPFALLLSAVTLFNLVLSLRRMSIYLSAMSLAMGYMTALITASPYAFFAALTALSAWALWLKLRQGWNGLLLYAILAGYCTHFLWAINNPILGNTFQLVTTPAEHAAFILVYAIIFSLGNLVRKPEQQESGFAIVLSILNCMMGYGLFLFTTALTFGSTFARSNLFAATLFIALAIVFWRREKSKYSTFIYAITGYVALSAAIIAEFKVPDVFIWLSWQSIVVVSTAIMFRSRFIVVANFTFYFLLLIAYLAIAGTVNTISLNFGVIALLSARIMNAQQHRLEIKTELMRYSYLAAAFCIFPYALYNTVPTGYVPFSWMGVALFYYIMHRVLSSQRYQLMALMTMLLTVVYVILIGVVQLEATYRIISFLALGIVLLTVSILFARRRLNAKTENK